MTSIARLALHSDLFSELTDFFGNDMQNFRFAQVTTFPKLNIYSYIKNGIKKYVVEAAISGFDPKEVSVTVDRNRLIFSYEKNANEEKNEEAEVSYYINEIKKSSFSRSVLLSDKLDTQNPETSYKDGVIRVEFSEDASKSPKLLKFLN
jgi:HSP20 family molecular chaperone IbpA